MFFFKKKKKNFIAELRSQSKEILQDTMYMYQNFLHWNISKICITLWSILLGVLCFFPFLIILILLAFIDPINWREIMSYVVVGQDLSIESVTSLVSQPFWLILFTIILVLAFGVFFIATLYALFLMTRLSLSYIHAKRLAIGENSYFSQVYFFTSMKILLWTVLYYIPFFIVFTGIIFAIFLLSTSGIISPDVRDVVFFIFACVGVIFTCLFIFRYCFAFAILAEEGSGKPSRAYLRKSFELTRGKNIFVKGLFVLACYMICMLPFSAMEVLIDSEKTDLENAYVYSAGIVDKVEPENEAYFNFLAQKYEGLSLDDITQKIEIYNYIRLLYIVFSFLVIQGLFIMLVTSFYIRVLIAK